jgi:N-acetylmuramoyl-L-alanine amidase
LIGDPKPLLILDPGHGGADPGASGNGIVEKAMTLAISLYQFDRFRELGIRTALTRNSDTTLEPGTRAETVKQSGASYCISNHINAAPSIAAAGAETIYSVYANGKTANQLLDAIVQAGQPRRRAFSRSNESGRDYYYMHRNTGKVETIIVEYGFCTSSQDAERLKRNWRAYAEAVVRGFCSSIGHHYSPPVSSPIEVPDTAQPVTSIKDIQGHWAESSIVKALQTGTLTGTSANRFSPDEPITRAQLAVLLDRLNLLDKEAKAAR